MEFKHQLQLTRRTLIRRTSLMTGAAIAGAWRAMPSTPACVLTTEQEEGPFYVDYNKMRRDITEGKPGVPLHLKVALVHAKRCTPLANAALDIWQCDASGVYSGFTKVKRGRPPGGGGFGGPRPEGRPEGPPPGGFGPPPGMGNHHAQDETRFLRGIQSTDSNGLAEFTTIYPGWYEGRTIHIHLKVHTTGQHVAHTGQLFFPEDITARIAKLQPYSKHQDVHLTSQSEDHIFQDQHGAPGLLTLSRIELRSDAGGFVATVTLAVDPDATPAPVQMGGPGGRPPGGGY